MSELQSEVAAKQSLIPSSCVLRLTVIDGDVDATVALDRGLHSRCNVGFLGNICLDEESITAQPPDVVHQILGQRLPASGDDHLRTASSEQQRRDRKYLSATT